MTPLASSSICFSLASKAAIFELVLTCSGGKHVDMHTHNLTTCIHNRSTSNVLAYQFLNEAHLAPPICNEM